MRIDELRFADHECVRMRHGDVELIATHSAGPRIISLRRAGQPNVLARLPDTVIERIGARPFRFIGGHRLWAAPEVPDVTYAPDDASVDVAIDDATVTLAAPTDEAGVRKTITITLEATGVTVAHELANVGPPRTVAPWAITQLVPGGTAVLPLGTTEPDPYQADRNIVAWPYSSWDDPLVRIEHDRIEIDAKRIEPTKFGTKLRRGWLAYLLEDQLFVKRTDSREGVPHADLDASGQVYAIRSFIELETLGPLVELGEGETAVHVERWELRMADPSTPVAEIAADLES